MRLTDIFLASQIGDSARHLEDVRVSAGGKAETIGDREEVERFLDDRIDKMVSNLRANV